MGAEQRTQKFYTFQEAFDDNAISVPSIISGRLLARYQSVADQLRDNGVGVYRVRRVEAETDEYGKPVQEGMVGIVREGQKDWYPFWRVLQVADDEEVLCRVLSFTPEETDRRVQGAINAQVNLFIADRKFDDKIKSGGFR